LGENKCSRDTEHRVPYGVEITNECSCTFCLVPSCPIQGQPFLYCSQLCLVLTLLVVDIVASVLDARVSVEHWWNDTDRGVWSIGGSILTGETEVLGASHVLLPFCPLKIPRGLTVLNPGLFVNGSV
jgi:hypothetical protein